MLSSLGVGLDLRIETERLLLRPLQRDDASPFAANLTPDVTRRLTGWPAEPGAATVLAHILASREEMRVGNALHFAIAPKSGGAMIGAVSVVREAPLRGEIGYHLATASQGRGYMTEAAAAALGAAWDLLDLIVVEAGAHPSNRASFRIMKALGMKRLGPRKVWAPFRARMETCIYWAVRRG